MVAQSAVAALLAWAENADRARLAAGPTPADVGGRAAVADAATELAASPWFIYLIDLAGHDDTGPARDDIGRRIDGAVIEGFARHDRYSSYSSATARLLTYPHLAQRLGRPLEKALLGRAEAAAEPDADPTQASIGATALETVLHLSTTGVCKPYQLLTVLTDLTDRIATAPVELCTRLPRIVGLAYEHFGDDALVTLLQRLLSIADAEPDAGFELAMADLRRALDAPDEATIMPSLLDARRGFAAVEAADEDRHDAQAYAAAIDAIVAFHQPDTGPLLDAANRLEAAVTQHHAWLGRTYSPPWNWTRGQAEIAWIQLSQTLTAAAQPAHDAWYCHPSQAIAALLDAYQAGRSFIAHTQSPDQPHAVEILVKPTIEAIFVRDTHRLALLDHALEHDPAFTDNEAAQRLHQAVHDSLDRSATGGTSPDRGGGEQGKVPTRLTAVLHRMGLADAHEHLRHLPAAIQDRLETLLWNEEVAQASTGNIKVERKLQELIAGLSTAPDWAIPQIAGPFKILLQQTLLYLVSRFEIGGEMGGDRTAFLRATPGSRPPKERQMHQDYKDWLDQGPIYNQVKAEVFDRGGGRADVVVNFPHASFSVECKREQDDASKDGLRKYVGQASAYTQTDAAFGILLVLDLTDHSAGAPDLFANVWVENVQRGPEEEARRIVVARLPGNRQSPYATLAPPLLPAGTTP
ncbi:hypothetical protein [Plantactinospora sp. BB1]|uniref:hypothetical protein n=1 Tax=Plantactinospora sp. BB1 TaxID=2071627 RepID=UPI000D16AF20|nr:hypothetical protein [Plantactinospora sp. BB1]AVT39633.1 hypothetical protein C6W10_27915 [Plantactinospora sp. BB1]